jgi:hypothetical protein
MHIYMLLTSYVQLFRVIYYYLNKNGTYFSADWALINKTTKNLPSRPCTISSFLFFFLSNKANLLIFKQQQIQNMTANASHQSKAVAMFRSILSLGILLPLLFIRLPIIPTFLSYLIHYCSQLIRFLCRDPILSLFTSLSKLSCQRFTYSLFPLHDSLTSYHFSLDALTLA